jgi:hypothetical protein
MGIAAHAQSSTFAVCEAIDEVLKSERKAA